MYVQNPICFVIKSIYMEAVANKSGFKSFAKLSPLLEKRFPNATKKEIRDFIESRQHDRHQNYRHKKPYMRTIFDPVPGCYFHDLIQQTDTRPRGFPHYFHVFIESNSRYAFAYPVNDKTAATSVETLKQFIEDNDGKPILKLTSDGECAFNSHEFTDFCHERGIMVKIILDKAHSTLGLVDRFVRTLRDMNQPADRLKTGFQYDKNHINFSTEKMAQLVDSYNNTYHKSIGCTPKQMFDNVSLERQWIEEKRKIRRIQDNIEGFSLPVGTLVRYRMNADDLGGHKRRSQFSREKYAITKRVGARYVISGPDGTKLTKSRFELIPADDNDPNGPKFTHNVERVSAVYV